MSDLITIKETLHWKSKTYHLTYQDADSFDHVPLEKCRQIYGICFFDNKIVVGRGESKVWNLIGGTIEQGETLEQALAREIIEESNTKLLSWLPVGTQYVEENDYYQLRTVCLVEPIGPFVSDPAGSVTEIKHISPAEFENYIKWNQIGKRLLERALLKKPLLGI